MLDVDRDNTGPELVPRDATGRPRRTAWSEAGPSGRLGGLVMVALGASRPDRGPRSLAVGAMALGQRARSIWDGLARYGPTPCWPADAAAGREIARKDPAIGSGGVIALIIVPGRPGHGASPGPGGSPCRAAKRPRPSQGWPAVCGPVRHIACGCRSSSSCSVVDRRQAGSGLGAWFAERCRPWSDGVSAAHVPRVVTVRDRRVCWSARSPLAPGHSSPGPRSGSGSGSFLVRTRRQVDGDVLGRDRSSFGFAAIVATGRRRDGGDVASPSDPPPSAGRRSGKSRFGLAGRPVGLAGGPDRAWFLATRLAPAIPEMDDRIERPSSRATGTTGRPSRSAETSWRAPRRDRARRARLIDGRTLWLSAGHGRRPPWARPRSSTAPLAAALEASRGATRAGRRGQRRDRIGGSCRCTPGARVYRDPRRNRPSAHRGPGRTRSICWWPVSPIRLKGAHRVTEDATGRPASPSDRAARRDRAPLRCSCDWRRRPARLDRLTKPTRQASAGSRSW